MFIKFACDTKLGFKYHWWHKTTEGQKEAWQNKNNKYKNNNNNNKRVSSAKCRLMKVMINIMNCSVGRRSPGKADKVFFYNEKSRQQIKFILFSGITSLIHFFKQGHTLCRFLGIQQYWENENKSKKIHTKTPTKLNEKRSISEQSLKKSIKSKSTWAKWYFQRGIKMWENIAVHIWKLQKCIEGNAIGCD